MSKRFYQTISLDSEALQKANARALGQEELVKEIFKANPDKKFSPSQIQQIISKKYDRNSPLTSWRRAMTNLTYADNGSFLRKTDEQVVGTYAQMEHLWELNKLSSDEELQKFWDDIQSGKFDDDKPKFIQKDLF